MAKLIIFDLDVKGKKVLVCVDFNVPIKDGVIGDDNRIVAALPTIKYIIDDDGKAILLSHLGRIKSDADKRELSLAPVAKRLGELFERGVESVPSNEDKKVENAIAKMNDGDVLVMENTRFQDIDNDLGKRESRDDPKLNEHRVGLGGLCVNDAFGTAHRNHASNVGTATAMKAEGKKVVAGFSMEKEIKSLGNTVANPVYPFVTIFDGARASDKTSATTNLVPKSDHILIGGGMAYTSLAAQGHKIDKSLFEADKVELAKEPLEEANGKIILPVDNVAATEFSNDTSREVVGDDIPDNEMGLDIGSKTVELLRETLQGAEIIVWNGPMGCFEMSNFAEGTLEVGCTMADLPDVTIIIGDGNSVAAVKQLGIAPKIIHISASGGAPLEYLEGKGLPGIERISNK